MPGFTGKTRFFLPNEDAQVVRDAIYALTIRPEHPLFVTGSGMLALDLLPLFHGKVTLVDIQESQTVYVRELIKVMEHADSIRTLQTWLIHDILPQINAYYAARGASYTEEGVLSALRNYFRIQFLFSDNALSAVRKRLCDVQLHTSDITDYLKTHTHDFVHLSNIVDYLSSDQLEPLFAQLASLNATVFCIETTAIHDREAFLRIVQNAGFTSHAATPLLQAQNRALGGNEAKKPWMRTGFVHLFMSKNL